MQQVMWRMDAKLRLENTQSRVATTGEEGTETMALEHMCVEQNE